jgi:molybdopterin converting factor small subunit
MRELMQVLKLPQQERLLLVVNYKQVKKETPLEEGDRVLILPFHGGG